MAIKIDFLADVGKFLRGTKDVAGALEDVAGSLDDLGDGSERAADTAGDALGEGFKDGARDADRALERVEDSLDETAKAAKTLDAKVSQAFKAMASDAKASGNKIGDSQRAAYNEAGEGLEDLKSEAASTAKESAASFDGSAESIVGSFQEIAANAFAGFGPAGAAAGLAMALGVGIAVTAMQDGAEAANEMKQKSVDMVDAIAEAGGNLEEMDLAGVIRAWGREVIEDNWLTVWANEASTKFQETAKDAKTYGVAAGDAVRAAAGSADDSRKFLDATAQSWQDLNATVERGRTVSEAGLVVFDESAKKAMEQRNALSDLRGQAEANIRTTGDAVEIYGIETEALQGTKEAAQAAADAVTAKAEATERAATAAMGAMGSEIDWIETLKESAKDIAANGKSIDNNTAAGRANNQTLLDMAKSAGDYTLGQVTAGTATDVVTAKAGELRAAFIAQAEAAGYPTAAAEALATSYGLVPANVDTLVQAHGTEEAKAAIAGVPEAVDTTVQVTAQGAPEAQGSIAAIEGTQVTATVTPAGTEETKAAIATIPPATSTTVQVSVAGVEGAAAAIAGLPAVKDVTVQVAEAGAAAAQATIAAIEGTEVTAEIKEHGVSDVQRSIDGIRGRDVPITVRIANLGDIQRTLDNLTAPRSLWVTVNQRPGVAVVP